jgi:phosphoglycolate phosphatase-like HAD superfamily hydrolase
MFIGCTCLILATIAEEPLMTGLGISAEAAFDLQASSELKQRFHPVRRQRLHFVASSATEDEIDKYLDIARITELVDLKTSSDDVEESKPAPDIFASVLKKLEIEGADDVAIGDTPYDAEAAGKVKVATIGVLCGGFPEVRQAGCVEIYP